MKIEEGKTYILSDNQKYVALKRFSFDNRVFVFLFNASDTPGFKFFEEAEDNYTLVEDTKMLLKLTEFVRVDLNKIFTSKN